MSNTPAKKHILVVEDNSVTREVIQRNLELSGYHVFAAQNVHDAVEILCREAIDLVITDYKMPRHTGLELIKYVRDHFRDMGIIMLTGYGSINSAVAAMKEGADEYVTKPFTDQELLDATKKSLQRQQEKAIYPDQIYSKTWERFGIIGQSKPMLELYSKIEKACQNNATVLLTGESGTGKELVARTIHYNHKTRSAAPFLAVNCPGIPDELFESEVFGHAKGAFTGAVQSRKGFFQAAEGGSLFLDEISEIPFRLQAKLLRVLQEKELFRIGETHQQKVDVRIITATNKNLEELVENKLFRQDLFFRLNIFNIDIPPLRNRGDDILLLAKHFALKYVKELGKGEPSFTDRAVRALKKHLWPGNVRELDNLIHKTLIMNDGSHIDSCHFSDVVKFDIFCDRILHLSLEDMTKKYVKDVLQQTGGNKSKALKILKIDRKTLLKKLT